MLLFDKTGFVRFSAKRFSRDEGEHEGKDEVGGERSWAVIMAGYYRSYGPHFHFMSCICFVLCFAMQLLVAYLSTCH